MISLRMQHHAGPSGYDRLRGVIAHQSIETVEPVSAPQRAVGRVLRRLLEHSGARWYKRANLLSELKTGLRWLGGDHRLFHFLYGENSFRYAGALKRWPLNRRSNRLIATFHTPSWKLREVVAQQSHLKFLDAVIVMSTSQCEGFAEHIDPARVFFVPHGTDTEYFHPACNTAAVAAHPVFVTVGHHLRDFDMLAEAARAVGQRHPDAEFVVVAQPDRVDALRGIGNVSCRHGISDDELLQLYQRATALLIPLHDATANNAVLEAMACGLPIVSTDLQGLRDYVSGDCAHLVPSGDSAQLTDVVLQLCQQHGCTDWHAMRAASRRQALRFDWREIGRQTTEVYRQVSEATGSAR